jgi:hypothetical protein
MRAPHLLICLGISPLAGAACTVVEAPESLEELVVFGFEHFDDGDEYLEAMGENMWPLVEEHWEGIQEGYHVDVLDETHLEAAGVTSQDTVSITGVLGAVEYTNEVVPVVCGVTWPAKDEIYEAYLEYDWTEISDRDCFLGQQCERFEEYVGQTVKVPILGEATQEVTRQFRWVEPADGDAFVVSRSISPSPMEFTSDLLEVDQQYALVIFVPWPDHALRVETFWVEARALGSEVPEAITIMQTVNTMASQAEAVDEFVDSGEGC